MSCSVWWTTLACPRGFPQPRADHLGSRPGWAVQVLLGDGWIKELGEPSPATAKYVAHLKDIAAEDPALLIPYQYSLYVPLLLGVLAVKVRKALRLRGEDGTSFFTVGDPGTERSTKYKRLQVCQVAVNSQHARGCSEVLVG
jgi:heme oxygenase